MESIIAGYQPLDLNQVYSALPKAATKVIATDKDLEVEIMDICDNLRDLCKLAPASFI